VLTLDQLHPTQDRVLIKPDPVPVITRGGIHIPETVNSGNPNYYTMTGTVVKVGPGAIDPEDGARLPMAVAVGDRVVFGRYEGKQVECDRVIYLLMRAEKIMGLSAGETVQPGYQPAKHSAVKGTPAPAAKDYQIA
jgi:chaperonin GroES